MKLILGQTVEMQLSCSSDECDEVDNEAFIFYEIPGLSSTHYKPSRCYERFGSEKLAIV